VKRIRVGIHTMDDKLFISEVQSLLKIIEHRNVVRFLGFYSKTHLDVEENTGAEKRRLVEITERLLCFEYISSGSLDKYITGTNVFNFIQPLLPLILKDTGFILGRFEWCTMSRNCPGVQGLWLPSGVLEIDFLRLVC